MGEKNHAKKPGKKKLCPIKKGQNKRKKLAGEKKRVKKKQTCPIKKSERREKNRQKKEKKTSPIQNSRGEKKKKKKRIWLGLHGKKGRKKEKN